MWQTRYTKYSNLTPGMTSKKRKEYGVFNVYECPQVVHKRSIHTFLWPKKLYEVIDVKYFLQFSKVVTLFGLLATLEEFCSRASSLQGYMFQKTMTLIIFMLVILKKMIQRTNFYKCLFH